MKARNTEGKKRQKSPPQCHGFSYLRNPKNKYFGSKTKDNGNQTDAVEIEKGSREGRAEERKVKRIKIHISFPQ